MVTLNNADYAFVSPTVPQ